MKGFICWHTSVESFQGTLFRAKEVHIEQDKEKELEFAGDHKYQDNEITISFAIEHKGQIEMTYGTWPTIMLATSAVGSYSFTPLPNLLNMQTKQS